MPGARMQPLEVLKVVEVGDAELPDGAVVDCCLQGPPDLEGLFARPQRGVQEQRVDPVGAEVLQRLLHRLQGLQEKERDGIRGYYYC